MFHDLNPLAGGLLVAWVSALLFGALLVIALAYLRLSLAQGLKCRSDRAMFFIVILQLLISAGYCGLCLQEALYGYVTAPDPLAYFADRGSPTHVAQTLLYILNAMIADGVLVWRLYVVYNENLFLVGPYMGIVVVSAVCGFVAMDILATSEKQKSLFSNALTKWFDAYWSLSIIVQVTASCLIAWKIWRSGRQASRVWPGRSSHLKSVLWMVLESGALLGSSTILGLAFYTTKKWAGDVVGGISGVLTALVPVSILLRVSLSKTSFGKDNSWPGSTAISVKHEVQTFPARSLDTATTATHPSQEDVNEKATMV